MSNRQDPPVEAHERPLATEPAPQRRKVGRPPKPWPEPIPDTPENVLRAVLATPALRRDEWEYVKRRRKSR